MAPIGTSVNEPIERTTNIYDLYDDVPILTL